MTPTEHSRGSGPHFSFTTDDEAHGTTSKLSQTTSGETSASELAQTSAQESEDDVGGGGRLWQKAEIHAQRSKDQPMTPRTQKFAESIMARTRSRADPDALVDNASSVGGDALDKPTRSMIKFSTQEEAGIIESTSLARKRVRVVQLLGIGLLVFLISFLGGFWVQSSCHFVSAIFSVGENDESFRLRFGLWKYSPVDSSFQGYSYCTQYDDEYAGGSPWFARAASLIALIGGGYSLIVLWIYLVFGRCNHHVWKTSIVAAALSGALQLSTLSIFAGPICQSHQCSLGPAGLVSLLAGCFYFFLAYEMHYNTPMTALSDGLLSTVPSGDQSRILVANLEMTDFHHGAKAYVRRLTLGEANPYPTLNQMQRENRSPMGGNMLDRDLSQTSSYQPPAVFV